MSTSAQRKPQKMRRPDEAQEMPDEAMQRFKINLEINRKLEEEKSKVGLYWA